MKSKIIKIFSLKCFVGLEKVTEKMMAMKTGKAETLFKEKAKSLFFFNYT